MIALPWKKLCANFILPCGENHYGFFLRCPTSFYNQPKILNDLFLEKGWEGQPRVSPDMKAYSKFDFQKKRIAVEVQFGHASFLGTDLLKFQMASYSNLDLIDFGVYITTAKAMQKFLTNQYGHNWEGSLNFEKVEKYLPYFKSAIQVPIYVIGIDV